MNHNGDIPIIMVDGRAVVPVAILSKVIEAVHYFAHPATPKTLELFKRQSHVQNLSEDNLRDRVCTYLCGMCRVQGAKGPTS